MLVRAVSLIALLAAVSLPARAGADTPVLVATVGAGDGFNISLRDAAGTRVTHLDPGTYTIQVHDESEIHNFHLSGPGVDMATAVETEGDATWTVTLRDGTYRFQCDPHATVMHGSFTVGTVTTPPAATKLAARVGPGRRISLRTAAGVKLTLLNGTTRAVITVNDRSRGDNFRVRGPQVNRATGIRFRGRVTWRLTLRPGTYVYRSDRHRFLHGTFTVTANA